MDKLEKDQLFLLALELDLPELLSFCSSSKRINDLICKRNDIWYYKLNKEFSDLKYIGKEPRSYYIKLKEILKVSPELRNILPLINIKKYTISNNSAFVLKIQILLQSINKNVLSKISKDYNNHDISGIYKMGQIHPLVIISFMNNRGLLNKEEFKIYYNFLIKELEIYMRDPSYIFDPSLWELGNMDDLDKRLQK